MATKRLGMTVGCSRRRREVLVLDSGYAVSLALMHHAHAMVCFSLLFGISNVVSVALKNRPVRYTCFSIVHGGFVGPCRLGWKRNIDNKEYRLWQMGMRRCMGYRPTHPTACQLPHCGRFYYVFRLLIAESKSFFSTANIASSPVRVKRPRPISGQCSECGAVAVLRARGAADQGARPVMTSMTSFAYSSSSLQRCLMHLLLLHLLLLLLLLFHSPDILPSHALHRPSAVATKRHCWKRAGQSCRE